MVKAGRNDPCLCGSGRKYKKCCGQAGVAAALQSAASPDTAPLLALLQAGRHAELEARVRELIAQHADMGLLWKLMGAALWAQRKDAIPALQNAARLLPDDAEAQTNLGNILRAAGRFEDAAVSHRRAIELQPDYADAHANLGSVLLDLGRPDDAVASFRRALGLRPDFALAHNNLGIALQQLDSPEQAIASLRRAIVMQPDFTDAHANLGRAQRSLGRLEEAAASYAAAAACRPVDADLSVALGDVELARGRPQEAAVAYRAALALRPDLVAAHSNLGNALRDLGQFDAAADSYARALALSPDLAEAHNNLGNVLLDRGRIGEAVASYRRALEINPVSANAHSNLGSALRELGDLDGALRSLSCALEIDPDRAEFLGNLAVVRRLLGHHDAAEASCRRGLKMDPASPTLLATLAELHSDRGDFVAAERLFAEALSFDPDCALAWAGIAGLRRMTVADTTWIDGARRIARRRLRPRDAANLHYAMGKYFDDIRDFDAAFASYRRANEIAGSYTLAHDRERLAAQFDCVGRTWDSACIRQLQAYGNRSMQPVFVVGMPRSGTTLAEQILASHPSAHGAGEQGFWNAASPRVTDAMTRGEEVGPLLGELAAEYLRMTSALSGGAQRVVDKMPANFAHLGMIHAALPDARIIHMQRNPIDTCLSIYFQNFHVLHSYANDLDDLAHYHDQYRRVMAHWRSTLPAGTMLEVRYEDLVSDPGTWARRMVEFVGLTWDPACLEFHRTARSVSTFSKWQVRQQISRASVERWRNYEPYVGPLLRLVAPGDAAR